MQLGWKEMKRNKKRFVTFGAVVFLISLLTFMVAGLANGLSQDNASLIKQLPTGTFYMEKDADNKYTQSALTDKQESQLLKQKDAVAFSIQMGVLYDQSERQQSVAFVESTTSRYFPKVSRGEVIVDAQWEAEGYKVGDRFQNDQLSRPLTIKAFVEQQTFNHAPVAFVHRDDFREMFRTENAQMVYVPTKDAKEVTGLTSYDESAFLKTIDSYAAEQLSLNMIVVFLIVISGMLFAIFFYMMNVQKIGLYGILKAIGVKTATLFKMMWLQMFIISVSAVTLTIIVTQLFAYTVTAMPFDLPATAIATLSIIFIIIGFIGATISGMQIRKIQPLSAIQQGER